VSNQITQDHLDPTTEISLDAIKSRAVKGVAILTGRTFLLSVLSLFATGILTVYLDPSEFGVFWIVSAIVNFLAYFSDVGLAAALIQKKEKVLKADLNTTFIIQQILVILLLVLLFAASPYVQKFYTLTYEGKILLYSLGFSLFLSSLKTIPSVLLERELEFGKLVIPQVLENLVYNISAVYFALNGYGIRTFTYAVLLRGIVGLISMYILKPWFPTFEFSKKALKKLLNFGVPYQANALLATIKDDGMTAYLGGVLGTTGIGLLGWAQKWAYMPLRLFMDHVLKVTFPAFSRMQDEKDHLSQSVTRSIFFVCFLVFPSVVGLLILAPILVQIIPRYEKWTPALIPLSLISVNTIFAASTTQLTNLLNAIGKIKTTFKLMIMWTILTWIFVPTMAKYYSINGAALGYSLVGLSSMIAIFIVYRIIKFSLYKSIFVPAIAASVMGFALLIIRARMLVSVTAIGVLIVCGAITYMITMYALVGSSIFYDAKKGFKAIFVR